MSVPPPAGLTVEYFDPNSIPSGSTIYVNGKRGTGKSVLIVDIMAFFRNVSMCVVICPTMEASKTYANHIPSLFIHQAWKPEIVDDLISAQLSYGDAVSNYPCLLVFDDCLFDPKFAKHVSTRNLYMNGRHANITVICAGQYMMDLPPAIRTNTDYVFMLTENGRSNRERLYKNFGGVFNDFKSFDDCLRQCTENYHALLIDNKSLSNCTADCVRYYKATPDLKFRMGHRDLWEYAAKKTNQERLLRGDEDEFVPGSVDKPKHLLVRRQPPPAAVSDKI